MVKFDLAKLGLRPQAQVNAEKQVVPAAPVAPESELGSRLAASTDSVDASASASVAPQAPAPESQSKAVAKVPAALRLNQTPISVVPAEAPEPVKIAEGPEGFKSRLDLLDSLIVAGSGIDQLSLDRARSYVTDIMVELRSFPEYEPILEDRDVHNIMVFMRASMSFATKEFKEKATKRENRASNKRLSTMFDLSSLGDPAASPKLLAAQNSGLSALASLNVDDIAAKMSKGGKK